MNKQMVCGYHVDEFREMFAMTLPDLEGHLLEHCCGVNAVNAELTASGTGHLISCDPLFHSNKKTLEHETSEHFNALMKHLQRDKALFDFSYYGSLDALIENRRRGMSAFFADYEKGKAEKRYVAPGSGLLPFSDFTFDFALSSYFSSQESAQQDVSYHLQQITELARVAKEVRIFPLIDKNGQPSPLLGPILLGLQQAHYGVEVREVSYHLQPQDNAMLRVWAQQCQVTNG